MAKEVDCLLEECDETLTGDSDQELLEQAEEHVADAHPEVELVGETRETIRSHIRDV